MTCTIDARWVQGTNVALNLGSLDAQFLQEGIVDSNGPELRDGLVTPVADGTWHQVNLDVSWLNVLTPALPGQGLQRYSVLSELLHKAGFDNSTALVPDWGSMYGAAEQAISLLIVEGMSRVGLTQNTGTAPQVPGSVAVPWISSTQGDNAMFDSLLSNTSAIIPPTPAAGQSLDTVTTQLQWSISIQGYSYSVDQAAHILAVTVVLVYVTVVVIHIGYVIYHSWFYHSWFSDAWSHLENVMALMLNSSPPIRELKNASAGVDSSSTYKILMRIRARKLPIAPPGQHEKVELVLDTNTSQGTWGDITPGQLYS